MKFTPKSADEIAEAGLLVDGDYDFTVQKAEESTSKAGNEMIVLDLQVFDGQGSHRTIRDYLVSSDGGLRKIRSFAVACGILGEYEAGRFEADSLVGKSGAAKIKRDANPGYEPKNAVAWYLDPAKARASSPVLAVKRQAAASPTKQLLATVGDAVDDDEIPF